MSYFLALATDYDGTIAHDGVVDEATVAALARLKKARRKLIVLTGRQLPVSASRLAIGRRRSS